MSITAAEIYAITAAEDATAEDTLTPWWAWVGMCSGLCLAALAVAFPLAYALHACLWYLIVG